MSPTLSVDNHHAPPLSPDMPMPNVFVVPPEEDHIPPWCCFDANEPPPALASPDINFPDNALSMLQVEPDAPWYHHESSEPFEFRDGLVRPRKGGETRSIMDVLMNDDYVESDDEMDMDSDPLPEPEPEPSAGNTSTGNDSEVVEVIKVRRYADDVQEYSRTPTPPAKPSKSLKSRASKAFRTLKSVGMGSLRSKSKARAPVNPTPDYEGETLSRSKTSVSRRSSAIFSQIFSPPTTIQCRPSVSSIDVTRPRDSAFPPSSGPRYPSSLRRVPTSEAPRSATLGSPTSIHFNPHDFRSPSPTPSTQTTSRRRFSMMNLNRIFSFSSPDEPSDDIPATSRDSSAPSTESSSGPDTPIEEIPMPLRRREPPDDRGRKYSPILPPLDQSDTSFEMQLDSLHFDSLSFDADRF